MSKEYTDKQINSMILHLRLNNVAEMYYLENEDGSDRNFLIIAHNLTWKNRR